MQINLSLFIYVYMYVCICVYMYVFICYTYIFTMKLANIKYNLQMTGCTRNTFVSYYHSSVNDQPTVEINESDSSNRNVFICVNK
jgi:ferric iron reductase protein FhuF